MKIKRASGKEGTDVDGETRMGFCGVGRESVGVRGARGPCGEKGMRMYVCVFVCVTIFI